MSEIKNNNEVSINIPEKAKIQSLREFAVSPEGQEEIISFVENLKSELGNKEGWISTCQKADEKLKEISITEQTIDYVNDNFKTFIDQMPPGHDKGHFSRDLLTSIVLYDSLKDKVAFQSEAVAGLLAGAFHDIGTSIIPRYQDNKYGAGHGETGAFLFWQVSEGLIDENTRKLAAYSIAAHAHYLKPVEVSIPAGYKRDKYWDETWADENNKLIGVAHQMARRSDRTDTNGVTLMFRHINSRLDSVEEGGQDLSGGEWVNLNHDSLIQTLNPTVKEPIINPPTTFEHVLRFARSNDGKNPYSEKDYLFPAFKEILDFKLTQLDTLINIIDKPSNFIAETEENNQFVHDLFYKVSKSDPERFEKAWGNFKSIWSELSPESKSKWYNGLKYSQIAYDEILSFYEEKSKNSNFANLTEKIINNLKN
jgi:hypothetical protein